MKRDALAGYHPAVIFLFFCGAIGFGVVIMHPAYLAAGCIGAAGYLCCLLGRSAVRRILTLVPVLILISILNPLLNTRGRTILFTLFGRNYTFEALCYGAAIGMMFVLMLLWFQCYSLVMTSDKFTALFGSFLPSLSLLLVMVLRLMPALTRKAEQISGVRALIGKGIDEGDGVRDKVDHGISVLSALTDHALEGSIITGDSMKARGYGCGRRTQFQIYTLRSADLLLAILMVLLIAGVLLFGGTRVLFTPIMRIPVPGPGFYLYCLFVALPVLLHIKEDVLWHILISRI